jgi:serine/threonine protein kinase
MFFVLQCDIWACGVLAYELLVGRPPFEVEDESETRKRIMFETTIKFPPTVSTEAINFIKTVLAKNAGMRPSASDLMHHAWLRPHLLAMAQRASHLNAAELRSVTVTTSSIRPCSLSPCQAVSNLHSTESCRSEWPLDMARGWKTLAHMLSLAFCCLLSLTVPSRLCPAWLPAAPTP